MYTIENKSKKLLNNTFDNSINLYLINLFILVKHILGGQINLMPYL